MAKGQTKSNKEVRKPKAAKALTPKASNASLKGKPVEVASSKH